ncbi:heme o synthase [Risungbinella massiliensis]|uniref:heme o synthase n=1 Tax=Risungbinella massiliensis TaxID=1329796 RepID=UPI0005CB82A2|nr:heme o synthase [Risungbinella massiliensis]
MNRPGERVMASQSYLEMEKATWRDYVDITKPGIIKSNLLATFTGYFVAAGLEGFDWLVLFHTLLGTAFLIAGGCALNNFYDRDIDPKMERTQTRAVAEGRIRPVIAMWYGILLTTLGFALLFVGVNARTAGIGFAGFVAYVFVYTMWFKRKSIWNTIVGGISGAVPPMIGWVAVTNSVDLTAWALFLILFMWQPPHFYALAIRRADEYRNAGVPMLPVVKGNGATKRQTFLFTILLVVSSLIPFWTEALGWFYLVAALALGIPYIVLAWKWFYTPANQEMNAAKKMFVFSLIYLTVMLAVMNIDVLIRGLGEFLF